jgi:transcriptional regulator with XRE-family HTH domain
MKEDRYEPDIDRVRGLLSTLLAVTRKPLRTLEKEMGLGSAGLSKILNGTVNLQLSHILLICEAAGVAPGRFFRAAYPRLGEGPSPAAEEWEASLQAQGVLPLEDESRPPSEELKEQVREALRSLLGL